ncbi:hypothetical protein CEE37_07110 [candidate division LCP-89 bacterium B3_LCP]|uniref:Peptidase S8/S53 domain-containing protein n=1 Tax=candidate division LCP-89 bacterium B3_LCP TaxID=2012998 RepID=A0A532V0I7_UNCL8|nr:MAG: hypothetical protein CEE37_07110 [candidate division LCP-89 bacterium B3_LCP]
MLTMKRILYYAVFTLAVLVAQANDSPAQFIESELSHVLKFTHPDEFVPVAFVLKSQLYLDNIYPQVSFLSKPSRRELVISQLKRLADETQSYLRTDLEDLRLSTDARNIRPLWISNVIAAEVRARELRELLKGHPEVARVHWDPQCPLEEMLDALKSGAQKGPTDVLSWGIEDIKADMVWDVGYRGDGILIATIDTGVDYNHPDLADHIWVNPGEDLNGNGIVDTSDFNGIDDDGNGYIDDLRGWEFYFQNPEVMDVNGHGTATAGIVVGDGTNGNTTGIAPEAKLMVLKNLGGESYYWEAQQYAIMMLADALTSSMSFKWYWSGRPDYATMRHNTEMELAAGLIHSNSIGNDGDNLVNAPIPFNISTPGNCPPPWLHPDQTLVGGVSSVLGVGAYNFSYSLMSYSGLGPSSWYLQDILQLDPTYGHPWLSRYDDYPYQSGSFQGLLKPDLAAPSNVLTTTLGIGYTTFGGTSAATPHLGGTFCLMLSVNPTASPEILAEIIMTTAIDMGEPGKDNNWGCGRLDAFAAVSQLLLQTTAALTGTVSDSSTGLSIIEAIVAFPSSGIQTSTDSSGYYLLPGIPEGSHNVVFTANGYDTLWVEGTSFTVGVVETLSVALTGPQIWLDVSSIQAALPLGNSLQTPVAIHNGGTGNLEVAFSKKGDWNPFEIYSGIQAEIVTGDDELFGVEVVEESVWVSGGNSGSEPNKLYRFSFDGELLGTLDQPLSTSGLGWRDLAWDGQFLYGSDNSQIFGIDLTGVVQDTITGPLYLHTALAYDPQTDHFFACDDTSNILEIDRDGAIQQTIGHDLHVSGLAWHPEDEDGMKLYIFSQDGTPAGLRVSKVNPDNGEPLFVTDLIGASGEIAGGATISGSIDPDRWCFVGMIQGVSDRVQYISLNAYAPWFDIDPPGGTILPGDALIAMVTLDAAQVPPGDYEVNMLIQHNAPQDDILIPVSLTVEPTAVELPPALPAVPNDFAVMPAYPNPFNPTAVISFQLPVTSLVKLEVFDITGRNVGATLCGRPVSGSHRGLPLQDWYPPGTHRISFDGSGLASGIYIYRLTAGKFSASGKMVLMK